jgi:hypothetical protein
MKIGKPVAGYVVEPIEDPVPRQAPKDEEAPRPERVAAEREPAPTR